MYSKCMYSPHTLVVMQPGLCCIVLLTASMTLTLLDTLKYGTSEHNTANTPEASSKLRERRERERWGERVREGNLLAIISSVHLHFSVSPLYF